MQSFSNANKRRGFTMVELLVVIAIMAILLAFASNMLKGTDKAKGLQSGVDLLNAAVVQARDIAKSRATWTRVVIPYEVGLQDSKDSWNLNYAAVMSWESDDPMDLNLKPMGTDRGWKIEGKGYDFPSTVYLDPDLSVSQPSFDIVDSGKSIKTKTIEAKLSSGAPIQCLYLEFDRQGRLVWPRGATKIVLISGSLREDGLHPTLKASDGNASQAGGFVILPNGQTTTLRNREQIFSKTVK